MYDNYWKLALNALWIILGAALLGLSMAGKLDSAAYSGLGGGLIGAGVLQLIRVFKYRKDAAYREKIDTEVNDERNRFLRMRSWAWTGYAVVLIQGVGLIAALILGRQNVQRALVCSICLMIGIHWAAYMVLSRKY